jgi:hypothetical protein
MKRIIVRACGVTRCHLLIVLVWCLVVSSNPVRSQLVSGNETKTGERSVMTLANALVEFRVVIDSNKIVADRLKERVVEIESDGDFQCDIMWTDWQAPHFINNGENPALMTKADFLVVGKEIRDIGDGGKEIVVNLSAREYPLLARVIYRLLPDEFYVRRKLAVSDTSLAGHFLQTISPVWARVTSSLAIQKAGGFGQPIALAGKSGGAFIGLEYPAADNLASGEATAIRVHCSQEMGVTIGKEWVESEWAVIGLTPDKDIRRWFMTYVEKMRVAPIRPYTLYNSWYDLRSAEYPKVAEGNVMNEGNVMRIIGLIKKNMIDKHGIALDAFVLDDGWDVYESDWVLREKQFPRGLKPISDELRKTNTGLGVWFGPTGGYSFRMKRIEWMKQHGYEVVGLTKNTAMLCLGGRNYSLLFSKRTTDFVRNDGVSYFKWDGIQFSCSEPDHGHPIGIYSRRAVLESLIEKCNAVRAINPNTYLNITSGTWLSPWWVKYANQIWMQGADYGYADVPSISPRDAAITYRDFVLYDDFTTSDLWFPIANLMTHGIIKGNLQMLGGRQEPLDKFTNEVLLYFARGVSMWELYISPDILTDGEWDAMGQAMHWAKDRFPVLSHTTMVGGDPRKRETYGYIHANGDHGIVAARNPWIAGGKLKIALSTANGFDGKISGLVLERVYPTRWVAPRLYASGDIVEVPLSGFETAIYEVYPVQEATVPLVGGATFDAVKGEKGFDRLVLYEKGIGTTLLNKDRYPDIDLRPATKSIAQHEALKRGSSKFQTAEDKTWLQTSFDVDPSITTGSLAILLTPAKANTSEKQPVVLVTVDGKTDTARTDDKGSASAWFTHPVSQGSHNVSIRIASAEPGKTWSGQVVCWIVCEQKMDGTEVSYPAVVTKKERPMPPRAFPAGVRSVTVELGESLLRSPS